MYICTVRNKQTILNIIIMNKETLVQNIWAYCKNTHNDQDYKDLQEFSVTELKEILTDIKSNN